MPAVAMPAAMPLPNRSFGRYALGRLLGKSDATMTWLATDRRSQTEAMLILPRVAPVDAAGIAAWLAVVNRAARLDHPDIARAGVGDVPEHWPYVAVERRLGVTLDEWLAAHPARLSADEAAGWIASVLRGLAFAHDAGVAHRDVQASTILVNERGQALVMAIGVAFDADAGSAPVAPGRADRGHVVDAVVLREQRAAAERDVLATGLLLNGLLAGEPALGVADTGRVIDRMAPRGREFVRLPWTTPQPVPEALRAIVNRSTAGQDRLRYRSARTFLQALVGWRQAAADDSGGPVALLLDRLRTVGHLPALPGLAGRVQRVTAIETQRTDDIARHLLPDLALSLELLRMLNSATVQGTQIPGNGPVLTLRRVVALIGVNGVREAANTLRAWPGPLDDAGARAMRQALDRVRLAGHAAQALRPAGYDAEVVYLIAALQSLGRLLVRYHFADEAAQIQQLMQPAPAGSDGDEHPGLDEAAACFAVLGVDLESFGTATARLWGFGAEIQHMIRRVGVDAPVRKPDNDADLLRIVASAANDAVDVVSDVSPRKMASALGQVAQRYARVLKINARSLADALQEARDHMRRGTASTGRAEGGGGHPPAAVAPQIVASVADSAA